MKHVPRYGIPVNMLKTWRFWHILKDQITGMAWIKKITRDPPKRYGIKVGHDKLTEMRQIVMCIMHLAIH